MDFCCPDPDRPSIVPDHNTLKHRRYLRYVLYGQLYATIVKLLVQGLFAGLFNLFSVWISYSAWASMFHCTLIFQIIYFCIDLLMLMAAWSNMIAMASSQYGFIGESMVYCLLVFYVVGLFISYRAYQAFKKEYIH